MSNTRKQCLVALSVLLYCHFSKPQVLLDCRAICILQLSDETGVAGVIK